MLPFSKLLQPFPFRSNLFASQRLASLRDHYLNKLEKDVVWKTFCEYVCHVLLGRFVPHCNSSVTKQVSYIVNGNVNVFIPGGNFLVSRQRNCGRAIHEYGRRDQIDRSIPRPPGPNLGRQPSQPLQFFYANIK